MQRILKKLAAATSHSLKKRKMQHQQQAVESASGSLTLPAPPTVPVSAPEECATARQRASIEVELPSVSKDAAEYTEEDMLSIADRRRQFSRLTDGLNKKVAAGRKS